MQPLPRRQEQVLQATVRHYVDTTEPVGSKILVRRFGLDASPATIRSAMGDLERRGLLTQPHTSAGRVPSQAGYRTFVDHLLPAPGAAALQLQREFLNLNLHRAALEDLLQHLARRLSELTGLLSLITPPQQQQQVPQAMRLVGRSERLLVFVVDSATSSSSLNLRFPMELEPQIPVLERWLNEQLHQSKLRRATSPINWDRLPPELIHSGRLLRQAMTEHNHNQPIHEVAVTSGLGGLLRQPEFDRTTSLLPLIELVEAKPSELLAPNPGELRISIGDEHPNKALNQCSVVQSSYTCSDKSRGHVALVGPMRMAYATACAAVRSTADVLQRVLN